jgi:alpha-L-fucosidase
MIANNRKRMKNMKKKIIKIACTLFFAACVQMVAAIAPNKPVEARNYDAVSSQKATSVVNTTNAADETSLGGAFAAGDYLVYKDIDFGVGGYKKFMLVLSADSDNAGKKIEVRLDSPTGAKIGEIILTDTRRTDIFKEHYADIAAVTGVHDVYLSFPAAVTVDMDFFVFTSYRFTPYNGSDELPEKQMTKSEDGSITFTNPYGPVYPYEAFDETKEERDARMEWYRDAGYGMFIHFGAYSYLGGVGLQGQNVSGSEWIMKNSNPRISKADYKDRVVAPFNPANFDAAAIVQLAKDAGQKYISVTFRHHEGFSMYDTKVRGFKDYSVTGVANNGNFNRDLMRELSDECKSQGVIFCAYMTMPDWYDATQINYGDNSYSSANGFANSFAGATKAEKELSKADYISRLKGQLRELVVDYDAKMIWFDDANMLKMSHAESYEVYHYIRSLNPDILVNNRIFTDRGTTNLNSRTAKTDFYTAEGSTLTRKQVYDFESCMTLNDNWGYTSWDNNWKSPATVIDLLLKCVGYGGNLLLNIGPDGNGNVPAQSQQILRQVGQWLATTSDAFYNVRPAFYETSELPSNVFATAKDGKLYLLVKAAYTGTSLTLDALENTITGARTLNGSQPVTISHNANGKKMIIDLSGITKDQYVTVIEISIDGGVPQRKGGEPVVLENIAKKMNDEGKVTFDGSSPTFISGSSDAGKTDPYDPNLTYGYKKTVDGVAEFASRWGSANGQLYPTPSYLVLNFTEPVTVNMAKVMMERSTTSVGTTTGNWTRGLKIEYWNGTDWSVAAEEYIAAGFEKSAYYDYDFNTVTTTKIRLNLYNSNKPAVIEFELYYDALSAISPLAVHAPLSVYPNPVKAGQAFTIRLNNEFSDAIIGIYSVTGLKLDERKASGNYAEQVINSQGMYIVTVKKSAETYTFKVVVE